MNRLAGRIDALESQGVCRTISAVGFYQGAESSSQILVLDVLGGGRVARADFGSDQEFWRTAEEQHQSIHDAPLGLVIVTGVPR